MNKPQNKVSLRGCRIRKGVIPDLSLDDDEEEEEEGEEEAAQDDQDQEKGEAFPKLAKSKGGPREVDPHETAVGLTLEHANKQMKLFMLTESEDSQAKWFKAMETFTKLTSWLLCIDWNPFVSKFLKEKEEKKKKRKKRKGDEVDKFGCSWGASVACKSFASVVSKCHFLFFQPPSRK